MSQPPKSTILAPNARWASLRTVFWVMGPDPGQEADYYPAPRGKFRPACADGAGPQPRARSLTQGVGSTRSVVSIAPTIFTTVPAGSSGPATSQYASAICTRH